MCHDLLRRSPRLTICSPLFFKVQSFIFIIALPLPLTFLRFSFYVFIFYVQLFYESFLRSTFLRTVFTIQLFRSIVSNAGTCGRYDIDFFTSPRFTPGMFPRHPYPLHPLVLPPIYPWDVPSPPVPAASLGSPPHLPLRCSLATRTRSIPWFSPPFTPEMLLCRQSQCDSACGLGSSLRLLYRHVPSS